MPSTLDAEAYPHLLDNVLCQLHLDGQYYTLAQCRLASSFVKHNIDRRLPQRSLICCHLGLDSVQLGDPDTLAEYLPAQNGDYPFFKASTRLWDFDSEGWRPSPVDHVVDVLPPSRAQPCCSGEPWRGVERVDVVRFFGCPDYKNIMAVADTAIYSPTPSKSLLSYVELPRTARRVVINMKHEPGRCPPNFKVDYRRQVHPPVDQLCGWVNVDQELVIMFTPKHGTPHFGEEFIVWIVLNVTMAMFFNLALKVTLLADDYWDLAWFTSKPGEFSEITDILERFHAAWFGVAKFSINTYKDRLPEKSYRERVKLMSKADYEAQVGTSMFQLMLAE